VRRTPATAATATPPWFVDITSSRRRGRGRSTTWHPSARSLTESESCHVSVFNDLEWPLTRISRSRHFWSRISEKRRVLKTKLLLHKRKLYLTYGWHYDWWPGLTSKRVARVCQHQLMSLNARKDKVLQTG